MTPVILLTGFLGSGKTTLLAGLLRQPAFSRTAVIINEFGETALDHDLIAVGEDGLVALTNGCLCCRVQIDLAKTLLDLANRRASGEISFDRVIIETSGLADPVPIVQALAIDLAVASQFRIDRTVTVVDALCTQASVSRYPEAARQIALADVLVLSKRDLAHAEDLEHTANMLDTLNQTAPRIGANDLAGLLDRPTSEQPAEATGTYTRLALKDGPTHVHGAGMGTVAVVGAGAGAGTSASIDADAHGGAASRSDNRSDSSGYSTVQILLDSPINASTVALFLEGLALHEGPRLLRLKGIVHTAQAPEQPMVIHGVQNVFFSPAWLDAWPSPDRRTRIVMIGHGLSAAWSRRLLDALEAEVNEVSTTPLQ